LKSIILQNNVKDKWLWSLHSSKSDIVNNAYNFLRQSANHHIIVDANLAFWHQDVPLKVNISVWRLLLNHLPTKDNLFKRWVFPATSHSCVWEGMVV